MLTLASQQKKYLIAFIAVIALLSGAAWLQFYLGVNPCPLCILQRITLGILGVLFFIGIIISRYRFGQITVGLFSVLFSVLGIVLSGRQVWLQLSPASAGANCEVSLQYMLQALPVLQVLQKILAGGAECSQIGWQFMHLSLAQWSLIAFVIFLLFSLWQLIKAK